MPQRTDAETDLLIAMVDALPRETVRALRRACLAQAAVHETYAETMPGTQPGEFDFTGDAARLRFVAGLCSDANRLRREETPQNRTPQ